MWQADRDKIQRMAPLEYIGRYMTGWWDYAIADELHQLAEETAQGNNLGVLYRCLPPSHRAYRNPDGRITPTPVQSLLRMEPRVMVRAWLSQLEAEESGISPQRYGVLESIEKIPHGDKRLHTYTKAATRQIRKPGASPLDLR